MEALISLFLSLLVPIHSVPQMNGISPRAGKNDEYVDHAPPLPSRRPPPQPLVQGYASCTCTCTANIHYWNQFLSDLKCLVSHFLIMIACICMYMYMYLCIYQAWGQALVLTSALSTFFEVLEGAFKHLIKNPEVLLLLL